MKAMGIVALSACLAILISACADSQSPVVTESAPPLPAVINPRMDLHAAGNEACVAPPDGILAWWPMDGDGTELIAERHVAISGAGSFENGMVEDGYAPAFSSPAVRPLDAALVPPEMTFSTWVRVDGFNLHNSVVLWTGNPLGQDLTGPFFLLITRSGSNQGRVSFAVGDGIGSDFVRTSRRLDLGQFAHVAVSFDGQEIFIYIDGELEGQVGQIRSPLLNSYPLQIGAISNQEGTGLRNWLDGVVDEVMFFDRALTQAEIQAIFAAASGGVCKGAYLDEDEDGVSDSDDYCPATVAPESVVPSAGLKPNHFALIDEDTLFDTLEVGRGKGPNRSYSLEDTAGCSCEQIIDAFGLGAGHMKHGCSIGVMDDWVREVADGS